MGFMDQIGGLLNQYLSGSAPQDEQVVCDHYDQICRVVPRDTLGSIIGPALGTLESQQLQNNIYQSARQMNPHERGDLLQTLLRGFLSSGINIPTLLGQLHINQDVANHPEQASPDDVARLAAHAKQTNPSIFDRAMRFYAEHPTLVKALGTAAIAAIARNLANSNRGRTTTA